MYAILLEDRLSEKNTILTTLAADPIAAAALIMAAAAEWCDRQPVNINYSLHPGSNVVQVRSGHDVVLTVSVTSITSVVGAESIFDAPDPTSVH